MTIKEIVLEIENRAGELSQIISHLYENDINVTAFSVKAGRTKASLRLVTSNPESALSVLTGLNVKTATAEAIAAQVPDHPGGLNSLLKVLSTAKVDIAHIYPCLKTDGTILILNVDEPEKAEKALKDSWIKVYDEQLYKL